MDKSTITKKYSNGEVTIIWKPGQCTHSTICWKQNTGLPAVFDPQLRPWIKPEASDTIKIIEQVKKCPSGALTYIMNDAINEVEPISTPDNQESKSATKIELIENGPYLISGVFEIMDYDGTIKTKENSCSLCRCGGSKNKPFCDGSHAQSGFNSSK